MDVTQGLDQELGKQLMGQNLTAGTGGLGNEIDVQDWKQGEVVFLVAVEETGSSDPVQVDVQINHGDTGSTSSELDTYSVSEVSSGEDTVETFTAPSYDRYMKIEEVVDNNSGASNVTVIALGGKRES